MVAFSVAVTRSHFPIDPLTSSSRKVLKYQSPTIHNTIPFTITVMQESSTLRIFREVTYGHYQSHPFSNRSRSHDLLRVCRARLVVCRWPRFARKFSISFCEDSQLDACWPLLGAVQQRLPRSHEPAQHEEANTIFIVTVVKRTNNWLIEQDGNL